MTWLDEPITFMEPRNIYGSKPVTKIKEKKIAKIDKPKDVSKKVEKEKEEKPEKKEEKPEKLEEKPEKKEEKPEKLEEKKEKPDDKKDKPTSKD